MRTSVCRSLFFDVVIVFTNNRECMYIQMNIWKTMRCGCMFLLFFFLAVHAFAQCAPASGPPPSNFYFNSGSNGMNGSMPPGATDLRWKVAIDDINGVYNAAVVMDSLP